MSGKTFGEMTPAERKAAMRRVADRLQAELQAAAPEITRIMDEAERRPCPLHFECERYQPAAACEYRSGEITFEQADQLAGERGGFPR